MLLLAVSCVSQDPHPEDSESIPPTKSESIPDGGVPVEHEPLLESPLPGTSQGGTKGSGGPPEEDTEYPEHLDECAHEEMFFEGKCTSKGIVQQTLDEREHKALRRYQRAQKPEEAAEAAHDLLEQQVAQAEKTEDDLDEILEILREEKRRRGEKKEASL